ncbi:MULTISPECIES: FAD:protein FMN transferase [unclassified Sphingomonas]|uniref:FAD:protein FMN transferase n=1 Tax=unclassified Sphingomonas TaxID=196159 RepID=UPI0005A9AFFA|nr:MULTISPECIES: FAD:protein FMN transferase [unclassified Sphingomonas]MDY1007181.1 FAD:protein FMN transferase [Sphingomonas sp. CFBP9019]
MGIAARVERFVAMGTRIELHVFGSGSADVMVAARRAIESVDDALTIHRPSPTTALNDELLAGHGVAIDDPVLIDALVAIDEAHALTLGLFDPAADRRFAGAGWGDLVFDRSTARIAATRPLALDFGGFGKGFALDRASAALRKAGVVCACLSAGESSIAVIGEHPLGGGWPFAIPDPSCTDAVLVEVELVDEALSISTTVGAGTQAPERAAMIRPTDGGIVTAARCTVAIDRSGGIAEAMSTALLVADAARARRLLDAAPARRFLYDLSKAAAPTDDTARMQAA